MDKFDVIVIGAGMAGLSAAYSLSQSARVLVLEREASAGYHSTGRSAALYGSSYGSEKPVVGALTKLSANFFLNPPEDFAEHSLYTQRGAMYIAHQDSVKELEAYFREMLQYTPHLEWIDRAKIEQLSPVLKPSYCHNAIYDKDVFELDVHLLQESFRRAIRRNGSTLVTEFEVKSLSRERDNWLVSNGAESYMAPVIVNAAGAWVDEIAQLANVKPLGISPLRRTAILVDAPQELELAAWPMVVQYEEEFYFKPEAGKVMISAANEDLSPPCDAQPEELEIAYAAHYGAEATTLDIARVESSWAGLRNFVHDRSPVIGFAQDSPGFFWLAGQGGFGIQTCPAAGRLVASLVLHGEIPEELAPHQLNTRMLGPGRLDDRHA
jgi:D-arginine dehydrogenase